MQRHQQGKKIGLEEKLIEIDRRLAQLSDSLDKKIGGERTAVYEEMKVLEELRVTLLTSIEIRRNIIAVYGEDSWRSCPSSPTEVMSPNIASKETVMSKQQEGYQSFPLIDERHQAADELSNITLRSFSIQSSYPSLWRFFRACCFCSDRTESEEDTLLNSK